MDNGRLLNIFFDNIEEFNKKACLFIKGGDIEKAIETYTLKIKYIRYAYEFDVISLKRAFEMTEDTKRIIDILS